MMFLSGKNHGKLFYDVVKLLTAVTRMYLLQMQSLALNFGYEGVIYAIRPASKV